VQARGRARASGKALAKGVGARIDTRGAAVPY
jgi:hypothetical protein